MIDNSVTAAAEAASLDARQRAAAAVPDVTVAEAESAALVALYTALKANGIPSPMEKWLAAIRGGDPRSNF